MAVHSDVVEAQAPGRVFYGFAVATKRCQIFRTDRPGINRDARLSFQSVERCRIIQFEPKLLSVEHLTKDHIVTAVTETCE